MMEQQTEDDGAVEEGGRKWRNKWLKGWNKMIREGLEDGNGAKKP